MPTKPRSRPAAAAVLVLVVLVFVVYFRALSNGFVWDDHTLIVQNRSLGETGAIPKAFVQDFWEKAAQMRSDYYRPLVTVTYAVDRMLYGLRPWGYHLTNLLVHAATTALLFVFLARLNLSIGTAFVGAALFCCHPVLAESVAWVSGRTDSVAALLVLLCLVADAHGRKPSWSAVALVALVAALLAKEMAVIIPPVAVLAGVARGEKVRPAVRDRLYMVPIVLAYFLARFLILGGPLGLPASLSSILRMPTRFAFPWHLVGLLVFPQGSRIDYQEGLPGRFLFPTAIAGFLLLAFLVLVGARERARDGSTVLLCLVGCGLLTLVPVAGALFVKGIAADRLVYLPAVFILPATALAVTRTFPKRVALSALLVATLGAAVWTASRVPLWRSDRELFEVAVRAPDPSVRAYLNLSAAYMGEVRLVDSFDALRKCMSGIEDRERSGIPLPYYAASAHSLLGLFYNEVGCDERAVDHYRESLKRNSANILSANNLSVLLSGAGRIEEAKGVLMTALAQSSDPLLTAGAADVMARAWSGPVLPFAGCEGPDQLRRELGDREFLNRRARRLLEGRQEWLAAILIHAVLRTDAADRDARLNLARLQVQTGETDAARTLLHDLLETDRSGEARELLAEIEKAQ